jgi:asparagine synthase (glutamine-hydrolysing)
MSAICAVVRGDVEPVPASHAAALLRAMCEYGDEASVWAPESPDAPVALGVIPWRVTPEDVWYRGPLRSADGRLVLVADARIDNRAELASALGLPAGDVSAMCDAGLILAAYEAWGRKSPTRLLGDFAFALWDGRARELFCARDGMGHRVLFYHHSASGFALATTPSALTALPHIRPRLNEQKVADFLVLLQRPETTFFEEILRIPAGHTLTVTHGGVRLERFWSPVPERRITRRSDQEYVEGFLEVFQDAVRARLRSASPIGIMASGGLDSSSVAAVAAEQLREQGRTLPTFHAAPRAGFTGAVRSGWVADETADVEAIARLHSNIELHIRRPDERTPLDDAEVSFRMTGAPPRNPGNAPWFYGIYRAASDRGIRVMLAGHKGNATISHTGYRSLRDSAARGQWGRVWHEVHALARATGQGRRNILRRNVINPLTPAAVTALTQRFTHRKILPVWDATDSAVKPEFARTMHLEERVRAARRDTLNTARMSDVEFRVSVLRSGVDVMDLYSGYRPWFGIETRDPTADRRVIEYCFGIPGAQYLHNGETRSLVRRAMAGRLPDQVRTRMTIGAQGPDWIEWLPAMRGALGAELDRLEQSDTANRCLDLPRMRALMDRWPEPMTVYHDRDYYMRLLRGIMMGKYIRWFEETYA